MKIDNFGPYELTKIFEIHSLIYMKGSQLRRLALWSAWGRSAAWVPNKWYSPSIGWLSVTDKISIKNIKIRLVHSISNGIITRITPHFSIRDDEKKRITILGRTRSTICSKKERLKNLHSKGISDLKHQVFIANENLGTKPTQAKRIHSQP